MRRFGFNLIVSMAALMLAVMAIFVGLGFGAVSLYLFLVTVTSPPLAALGTAGGALLFALVIALAASMVWRSPRARNDEAVDAFAGLADALGLGKSLGTEGRAYLSTHMSKAAIAAFGVGIAMGVSPRLRKLIADLLLR